MPLKVGNFYISQNEQFDYSTEVLDSLYIDTLSLISSKAVGADTFFSVRISGKELEDSAYLYNRSDGLWGLQEDNLLVAKYPASVGDSFSPDTIFGSGSDPWCTGKWVLVAKDDPVSVPAGIFKCYKYQKEMRVDSTGELYKRDINWMAPGIGFVKYEAWYNDSKLHIVYRQSLVGYHLE